MRSMASTIRPVSTRRLEEAEPRWGGQLFGQGAARVRSKPEPICVWIGVPVWVKRVRACVYESIVTVICWTSPEKSLNQDDFF